MVQVVNFGDIKIKLSDTVTVSFNNSQITLCCRAKVLQTPYRNNGEWIFQDMDNKLVYHVSEGCTVCKVYE